MKTISLFFLSLILVFSSMSGMKRKRHTDLTPAIPSNTLWLLTSENEYIPVPLHKALESELFRMFINRRGCNTQETALKVGYSKNEIEEFDKALDDMTQNKFDKSTIDIALRFKAAGLYAMYIKSEVPRELDQLIASLCNQQTDTIQNLKNSLIQYEYKKHCVHKQYLASENKIVFHNRGNYYILINTAFGSKSITLFDAPTHTLICTFPNHTNAHFHPHHNLLLLGNNKHRTTEHNVIVYDIENKQHTNIVNANTKIRSICTSADGKYIAAHNSFTVKLWELDDKKNIKEIIFDININNGTITTVAFHPDSKHLFVITYDYLGLGHIYTCNLKPSVTMAHSVDFLNGLNINAIEFNHDASFMILKALDGNLKAICNISNISSITKCLRPLEFERPLEFDLFLPCFIPKSNIVAYLQQNTNSNFDLCFYNTCTNSISHYQTSVTPDRLDTHTIPYFFDEHNRMGIIAHSSVQGDTLKNIVFLIDLQTPNYKTEAITFPIKHILKSFQQNEYDHLLCNVVNPYFFSTNNYPTLCNKQGEKLLQLQAQKKFDFCDEACQLSPNGRYIVAEEGTDGGDNYLKHLCQWTLISDESNATLDAIAQNPTISQLLLCEHLCGSLKTKHPLALYKNLTDQRTFNSLKEEQKPVILKIINHIKK